MNQVLYHHKWMDLCANADDEAFIKMQDAVMMVAVNEAREILLIEGKSIAYRDTTLTLPTGGVEEGEAPESAANRELQEEIGYQARKLELLGILHPSVKYARWRYWVYLAQELTVHKQKGDEKTPITVKPTPLAKIGLSMNSGKIKDSTAIAALFMVLNQVKMG